MLNQPYLTGFPTKLFGSTKRSAQEVISKSRESIESCGHLQSLFGSVLKPSIFNSYQTAPGSKRVRDYPYETTFWGFLSQVLGANGTLGEAVACIQAWKKSQGKREPSAATGAYCRARQALPLSLLKELHQETLCQLQRISVDDSRWHGHIVKQVDGTTVQTADTEANQAEWPQPSEQKEGCGFPVAHVAALLNWTTGAWDQWCVYPSGNHESKIMQELLPGISKGDVLVADRAYHSYHLMCQLLDKEAHLISRLHQRRKICWEEGEILSGQTDRLFTFKKPYQQPYNHFLSKEQWDELPKQLKVRIIRTEAEDRHGNPKPMWIATTLTDHEKYPANEIATLYKNRWDIELRIRDIKTTMEMELLRTQSPGMVKRELMMFAIGFNLLRFLQLKAANENQICPNRLSFKGVMDVVAALPQADIPKTKNGCKEMINWVSEKVGERIVPLREGRSEPRAKKRRPKPYQLLTKPRREFREILHKEHYRKQPTNTSK